MQKTGRVPYKINTHCRAQSHFRQYVQPAVNCQPSGAKHSPPGGKFQKSGGPRASMVNTPFHQVSYCQIVSEWRILHSDYNDFQCRFQLRPPQVLNQSARGRTEPRFYKILRFLWKVTSWNPVIWSLAVSNTIPNHFWYHRKSPYVSWFIFKIIDFWWFLVLMISNDFGSLFLIEGDRRSEATEVDRLLNPCAYVNEIWLKMATNGLCESANFSTLGMSTLKSKIRNGLHFFHWYWEQYVVFSIGIGKSIFRPFSNAKFTNSIKNSSFRNFSLQTLKPHLNIEKVYDKSKIRNELHLFHWYWENLAHLF